jgi:hypothetical protein
LTSIMTNCGNGWTGIPFTGKVQINVTSSSGPLDVYVFTQWEGRGQQVFDSIVCSLHHPTSSSQNCGIVNTPPQCIFARAQVFNGRYDVNLPANIGAYYYVVFAKCCSSSVTGSTVIVIMSGSSELISSFNQRYLSSISPYYVSSLNITLQQHYASSFNITSYMVPTQHTAMTMPPMPDTAVPLNMNQLPKISQLLNTFTQLIPNITPLLALLAIEIVILRVKSIPFKRKKESKSSTKNCAECGRGLSQNSMALESLSWDYCRVCERKVCLYCLERLHNDNCELRRY